MPISIIAAVAKNGVIGKENALPWYLPEDLKRFKELTSGKTVMMGRKTFESIMKRNGKPLPNRKNVVITKQEDYPVPEGVLVYNDLKKALLDLKSENLFVIGGGEIYRQTIDVAGVLYITHVDQEIEGDVYFPKIGETKWKKVLEERREGFSFVTYMRTRVWTQTFGVVGAIIEKEGRILLVKEADKWPDPGKFSHPAGWIDVGENPIEACAREVAEETGFEFKPTAILGIYSLVQKNLYDARLGRPHSIKIIFLGEIGKEQKELHGETASVHWFTAEEIYAMDGNTLRDVDIKQMVKDYLAGKRYPLDILTHTVQE
ncbi:MAG: dihydrofolate reductase [Candidatus Doudnabacteria bacterium]|nr:dihydrofolate reductase [Candidatus Doudnabacteria bacterium]